MKKILIPALLALLAVPAFAQSPTAFRDPVAYKADKAIKARATALESDVATAQADIDAVEAVAAAAVPKASLAVLDTNAVVNATLYVPAFAGQILIGTVSNVVFVAEGTTTNSWILITN